MKKIVTLIIILNMTFFVNAQLQGNSSIFSSKQTTGEFTSKAEKNGLHQFLIARLQKATSHVNFSPENVKLISSLVSGAKSLNNETGASSGALLDSIVIKDNTGNRISKFVYSYDSNGNDTTQLVYNRDNISLQWTLNSKIKKIRDINGLITSYESYSWFGGILIFGNEKYENTYNTDKQILTTINYQWDVVSSTWNLLNKTENTYDGNKNLVTIIDSKRDNNLNVWVNNMKSELNYNGSNKLTFETNSNWDINTSTWVDVSKNEHNYNAQGNDTLNLGYNWISNTSTWAPANRIIYTYDNTGNLTGFVLSNWDANTSSWVPFAKDEFAFDTNKNTTLTATYFWDTTTSSWSGLIKITISYYAGTHLEFARITYMGSGSTWVESTKSETVYNGNNDISTLTMYNWNSGTSAWDLKQISTYYYTLFVTGIPSVAGQNGTLYPNPVTTELHIDGLRNYSQIVIVDLNGKIVYSAQNLVKTVDVSTLKQGIYFLQLTNSAGKSTFKFIKIR